MPVAAGIGRRFDGVWCRKKIEAADRLGRLIDELCATLPPALGGAGYGEFS